MAINFDDPAIRAAMDEEIARLASFPPEDQKAIERKIIESKGVLPAEPGKNQASGDTVVTDASGNALGTVRDLGVMPQATAEEAPRPKMTEADIPPIVSLSQKLPDFGAGGDFPPMGVSLGSGPSPSGGSGAARAIEKARSEAFAARADAIRPSARSSEDMKSPAARGITAPGAAPSNPVAAHIPSSDYFELYSQFAPFVGSSERLAKGVEQVRRLGIGKMMDEFQGDPGSLEAMHHYGRAKALFGDAISPKDIADFITAKDTNERSWNQDARAYDQSAREWERLAIDQTKEARMQSEEEVKRASDMNEEKQKELKRNAELVRIAMTSVANDGLLSSSEKMLMEESGFRIAGGQTPSIGINPITGKPERQLQYTITLPNGKEVTVNQGQAAMFVGQMSDGEMFSGNTSKGKSSSQSSNKGQQKQEVHDFDGVTGAIVRDEDGNVTGWTEIQKITSKSDNAKPVQGPSTLNYDQRMAEAEKLIGPEGGVLKSLQRDAEKKYPTPKGEWYPRQFGMPAPKDENAEKRKEYVDLGRKNLNEGYAQLGKREDEAASVQRKESDLVKNLAVQGGKLFLPEKAGNWVVTLDSQNNRLLYTLEGTGITRMTAFDAPGDAEKVYKRAMTEAQNFDT